MVKYTAIEKLNVLFTLIKSSPFFLTCFIISLFIISFVALDYKTTKKVRGKLILLCLIGAIGFIIYKYYKYLLSISDNLIEEIFMALYFPNLAVYSIIIVITNICLFTSLIKKELKSGFKIANIFSCVSIDFLFILILETIIKNKIDVYETLTVYSNKELLILLELSTCVFLAWILVTLFLKLVDITVKKEKVVEEVKQNVLYEAPLFNKYVYNDETKVIPEIADDYTNVFAISSIKEESSNSFESISVSPINTEIKIEEIKPKIEPVKVNTEIKVEYPVNTEIKLEPVKIEETKPQIEPVKETEFIAIKHEDPILEVKPLEIPVVLEIKEEEKPAKVKKEKIKFTSLFNKKEVHKEEETYRVPLFDTLNDDAIMNCIVPIKKEKIIPAKSETAISIEKQEMLNNANLDSDQCRMLKDYLLKQG